MRAIRGAKSTGPGSVAGRWRKTGRRGTGNVLSTLTSALSGKLNPDEIWSTPQRGGSTVFAPTNAAFDAGEPLCDQQRLTCKLLSGI